MHNWQPLLYEDAIESVKNRSNPDSELCSIVADNVNFLICCLYKPDKDLCFVVDKNKLKRYKIDINEPVNWGDLSCTDVKKIGNEFLITIEEASPNECPTLCNYIRQFMRDWGWEVRVETKW
jgi:hypothetical protein